jgi:hypothetical protein
MNKSSFEFNYGNSSYSGEYYRYITDGKMAYYKNKDDFYISWSQDTFTWKLTHLGMDSDVDEPLLRIHREDKGNCFLEKNKALEPNLRKKREIPLISNQFNDEKWKIFDSTNLKWLSDAEIELFCLE